MDQRLCRARARAYRVYVERVTIGAPARAARWYLASSPVPEEFVSQVRKESEAALSAAHQALAQPPAHPLPACTDLPKLFPPADLLLNSAGLAYEPTSSHTTHD